ncbi:IclR family transcriptional regulator [Ideonella sp. B508-1]|uniref:IclR family transcriptional regulator n=1 Tax=Ideonella sp. B508-1 TaxID=137716 RepID=UPI000A2ED53B|nr:IclR family transcriptional regulator [Ideonella sp. B508-1]
MPTRRAPLARRIPSGSISFGPEITSSGSHRKNQESLMSTRKNSEQADAAIAAVAAAAAGPDRDASGPRSLARLLGLFDVLSLMPNGMSLAELNVTLESPKSSLLNLLRPLVAEGYLVHNAGLYRLGPSIFRLAASVMSAWNFPRMIRPFMDELVERTGESALLSVLNREAEVLTYVEIVDSPNPIRYQIPVGTTRPIYSSTAGRLLLAFTDKAWRDQYVTTVAFKLKTAIPITRASLVRELDKIRSEGVSSSIDGYSLGLAAVAAPVFDGEGRCIASLNIAGPSDRFRHDLESLKTTVKDVAARASGVVGGVEARRRSSKG